jgi:HEAT repeat protein
VGSRGSRYHRRMTGPAPASRDAVAALLPDLAARSSAKRRSAAKKLRRLGDPAAGPALLAALQHELEDVRTWETQYQMVQALGECGHRPALPLLLDLAQRPFEATMVLVAVGDALVRLASDVGKDATMLRSLLSGAAGGKAQSDDGRHQLAQGAARAVAMQRVVPDRSTIELLLRWAERFDPADENGANARFWVAAAAAGWLERSPLVRPFLEACSASASAGLRDAAKKALKGKYGNWRPL